MVSEANLRSFLTNRIDAGVLTVTAADLRSEFEAADALSLIHI